MSGRSVRKTVWAALLAFAAGVLTRLLGWLLSPIILILFFTAIALSAWRWGRWAGITAAAVSAVIVLIEFLPELRPGGGNAALVLRYSLFLGVSALLIFLMDNLRRTRDSLAASQARLSGVVRTSGDAIITLDERSRIRDFNGEAERILGYREADVIGLPVQEVLPEALARLGNDGAHCREVEGRRKDGAVFIAEQSVADFRVAGERTVTIRLRDVTERRRAEQERQSLLERERAARASVEQALEQHRILEEELSLLVEASATLLGSVELSKVLPEVLALARRFLAADAFAVWRERKREHWEMLAAHGLSERFQQNIFDASAHAEALESGPLLVGDVTAPDLGVFENRRGLYAEEGIKSLLVVPLRIHGTAGGTIAFYYHSSHRFPEAEVRIATALGNLTASAIGSAELYEEQRRLRAAAEDDQRRSAFLAEATATIAGSLDYHGTLAAVARLAVPSFADWAAVDLLADDGRIDRLAVAHADPAKVSWAHHLHERYPPDLDEPRGLGSVLRTGKAELYPEIGPGLIEASARDEEHLRVLRQLGMRSAIVVPMIARGRTLGAITFVTSESGRRFGEADLAIGQHLGRRAALAVDNAMLYAAAERRREEAENAVQALRRSNEDLQQFAYVASHDLQEPLRMVANYTQLLARRYQDRLDGDARDYINFAVEGVVRMRHLIDDLLAYSRAAQGNGAPPAPVSAEKALEEAMANLRLAIEESRAEVTHDPLPMVRSDPAQLSRVFQNLVANAVKYRREEPPRIHVGVRRENYEWVFTVKDNGVGIDARYFNRIFGVFTRLQGREYEGTGMGLAICRRIVERLGGRIWVSSVPGQGSTFSFTIPE